MRLIWQRKTEQPRNDPQGRTSIDRHSSVPTIRGDEACNEAAKSQQRGSDSRAGSTDGAWKRFGRERKHDCVL
jgi:hypothetical protein